MEVIAGHVQNKVIEALLEQPFYLREQVEEVSVDMWGDFPKVIERVFPNAQIVFDRSHVMKPVNDELNKVFGHTCSLLLQISKTSRHEFKRTKKSN